MATNKDSVLDLQHRLNQLHKQQIELESKRDQQLLSLIHRTDTHKIDPLVLTGALLELQKTTTANPSQTEVWRKAGENFLYPRRKSKAASFTKEASAK